jgi:hypothetical protein
LARNPLSKSKPSSATWLSGHTSPDAVRFFGEENLKMRHHNNAAEWVLWGLLLPAVPIVWFLQKLRGQGNCRFSPSPGAERENPGAE